MTNKILKKLKEHDEKFIEHGKKIDEHGKKLDEHGKKLDEQGKKLDEHGKKLDDHGEQLETIATYVLDNRIKIDNVSLNVEKILKRIPENLAETLDAIRGKEKTHDQELVFVNEHLKRIDKDIDKIKPLVGLA